MLTLTCVVFDSPIEFLSQVEVLHSESWFGAGGPTLATQCLDSVYTVSHIGTTDHSLLLIAVDNYSSPSLHSGLSLTGRL